MRVLGVVDLMGGRAVHARGGRREHYAPVGQAAGVGIDGDPAALARLYVQHFGIGEVYVADLDAIVSATPQEALTRTLAAHAPLWLDSGVSSAEAARQAIDAGATHVIVGLETLSSLEALAAVSAAIGGHRVAFSLDLRNGIPVARAAYAQAATPEDIAREAAAAGAAAVIVLDLARVGAGAGVDLEMLRRVRAAVPAVSLLAGGGIRGLKDLTDVARAGCDGALVASALHDGRISAADIAAAGAIQRSGSR